MDLSNWPMLGPHQFFLELKSPWNSSHIQHQTSPPTMYCYPKPLTSRVTLVSPRPCVWALSASGRSTLWKTLTPCAFRPMTREYCVEAPAASLQIRRFQTSRALCNVLHPRWTSCNSLATRYFARHPLALRPSVVYRAIRCGCQQATRSRPQTFSLPRRQIMSCR